MILSVPLEVGFAFPTSFAYSVPQCLRGEILFLILFLIFGFGFAMACCLLPVARYSARSACVGSIAAARRAGISAATAPINTKTITTPT